MQVYNQKIITKKVELFSRHYGKNGKMLDNYDGPTFGYIFREEIGDEIIEKYVPTLSQDAIVYLAAIVITFLIFWLWYFRVLGNREPEEYNMIDFFNTHLFSTGTIFLIIGLVSFSVSVFAHVIYETSQKYMGLQVDLFFTINKLATSFNPSTAYYAIGLILILIGVYRGVIKNV